MAPAKLGKKAAMTSYLNILLAFISHHAALAYVAVFLISLSESLALVGLLVPGTVIMFGVGALVATGTLRLTPVLLLAMTGAVTGDGISYWLGHHYKERLVTIWPFSRYPEMLKIGETFFLRHGGKSVLFGRFVGPVRPVIPLVAGMMGMKPLHFSAVNVLSAVGWALAYILPGIFFGTSLAMAGAVSTRLAVVVFLLVAGGWGFIWICRRIIFLITKHGPGWLLALYRWSTSESPANVFVSFVKRCVRFLLFHGQGEEWLIAILAVTLFIAGWGFLGILQDVLARDPLVIADQAVYNFFQSLRTIWFDNFFVTITEFGDSFVNVWLTGAVLVVLLARRCYRTALFWALTALGGLLGVQLLKSVIHLPRPIELYHGASMYGFPSSHTAMSVILYGFIAILLARRLSGRWRWGLFSVVLLISFVIGFSRLYLGAHWLSDVLGGYFIGMSWTAFMGIICLKGGDEMIPRRLLALTVAVVLLVAGSWHAVQRHADDLVFYSPQNEEKTTSLAAWQAGGWQELPAWRIDMEGEPEQPLTVQWAGSIDDLARVLEKHGWQQPLPLNLKKFLGIFSMDTPLAQLPLLPRLHDGRAEDLLLVRIVEGRRLVLRLWPSDVISGESSSPLVVGTLEEQRAGELAHLIAVARDTGNYERPLLEFEQTLRKLGTTKLLFRTRHDLPAGSNPSGRQWRGEVLLGW